MPPEPIHLRCAQSIKVFSAPGKAQTGLYRRSWIQHGSAGCISVFIHDIHECILTCGRVGFEWMMYSLAVVLLCFEALPGTFHGRFHDLNPPNSVFSEAVQT